MRISNSLSNRLGWIGLTMAVAMLVPVDGFTAEVNVYSARKEALIKPLLDRFTADTGITVNLVTGNASQLHARQSGRR